MPTIFKPDDFEVSTAMRTQLFVRHQEPNLITSFKLRPRVNPFESIKQDLPSFYAHFLPCQLGHSGLYHFLTMKAAYVDFAYSDQLTASLQDFRSTRLELRDKVQRPITLGPITLTPFASVQGIFYSNSPSQKLQGLGFFTYGADLFAKAQRSYHRYKHVIEPYAALHSLTRPTVAPDDHYIFSIADGYEKIDQVRAGIRNLLFSNKRIGKEPSFAADLFANAFFSETTIPQFIPRLYLDLTWRLPSLHCTLQNAWNFRNHVLDFSKARFLWTVNENLAFSLEGRYRSSFDWRKADHENFMLDVTRLQSELLLSPLSDRRISFLAHAFIRFNPLWDCQISFINGFYRPNEKPYVETRIDFSTWISSSFKLRFAYSYINKKDRFIVKLDLIKK